MVRTGRTTQRAEESARDTQTLPRFDPPGEVLQHVEKPRHPLIVAADWEHIQENLIAKLTDLGTES